MKKIILVLLASLLFVNCNAQKNPVKKVTSKKQNKMNIPNITKEDIKILSFKKLIDRENKKILAKTNDSSQLIDENAKELYFEQNGFASVYKNKELVYMQKETEDTIQKPIPRKNFPKKWGADFSQSVRTTIEFYPNGPIRTIKQFILTSNGSFNAGNWYAYDEAGNLLQHIDHEKHFKMSYYDVAKIADTYVYPSITMGRYFNNKKSFWVIQLNGFQDQPIEPKIIIIDDKTGKVLHEMNQEEFANFRVKGFDGVVEHQEVLYKQF